MAVPDLKVEKISLGENKVYLQDGRAIPLDPELKEMIQNPEQARRVGEIVQTRRDYQSASENVPGMGSVNAFSSAIGRSAAGNLFKNYLAYPAAGAIGAIQTRPGQEEMGFLGRMGENIKTARQADQYFEPELKEKYPMSSRIGSIMGFGSDVALASTVPGGPIAEGAALGFSGSPAIYDDPGETLKETAIGAGIGYGAGKIGEGIGNVAAQRAARREFQTAMENLPAEQRAARQAFRQTQKQKLQDAAQDLRRGVSKSSLNNNAFIQGTIRVSESAGTAEGKAVESFVTTVESGLPEKLGSNDIVKLFDAVEGRIATASEAELPLLQSYKQHLVDTIPQGAANQAVKDQVGTLLINQAEKRGSVLAKELGSNATQFNKNLRQNISELIENMTPQEFTQSLASGELRELIKQETQRAYREIFTSGKVSNQFKNTSFLKNMEQKGESIAENMVQSFSEDLQALQAQADDLAQYVQKRVSSRVRNATGSPNPITPEVAPTNQLTMPQEPVAPTVGRMAERFETQPFTPMQDIKEAGSQSIGLGLLGKLFGLPTKAVAGARALYGGAKAAGEGAMRFITAPTRVAEMTRETIRKGGIPVLVESISTTYPSYEKGILLDPLDRQDAVAELENNPYIPLEQKAILQAKINRGRSLEELKEFKEEVK